MTSLTNRQIRAVIYLVAAVVFSVVALSPAFQAYIFENAYIGTSQGNSSNSGYTNNEPGWSSNIVVVHCPFDSNKEIISTDPRYTEAEGRVYCEVRREPQAWLRKYLLPVLALLLLAAAIWEIKKAWSTNKPYSAIDKKIRHNR